MRNRTVAIAGIAAAAVAFAVMLWVGSQDVLSTRAYLIFHTHVELFSVAVSVAIFMLAWNARRFMQNHYLLFVGTAYLFVAFIDLIHTLAYKGMGVFDVPGANLSTQLWVAARYLQAGSLLIAPLFLTKRMHFGRVAGAYVAITALILLSIFQWNLFPVCSVEGLGQTQFKVVSEYVISAILAAALIWLIRRRRHLNQRVLAYIAGSIAVTIASELTFTKWVGVYDVFNMLGHLLKVVAVFLIYKALVETGLRQPHTVLWHDLKQREQALRESEQRYRTVAEFTYDWEYWRAPDGRFLYVSPAVERVTGYRAEEFTDDPDLLNRIVHPDEVEAVRHHAQEVMESEERRLIEFRIIRRDGEERWISHACRGVRDADGQSIGCRASNRDITESRLAEQERERQREFLEKLIARASTGIAVLDLPDYRFSLVNPAFQSSPGNPKTPLVGRTFANAFPRVAKRGLIEQVNRAVANDQPLALREYEIRVGRSNRTTWWNVDIVPLGGAGRRPDSVLLLTQEATDQVRARQRVEQLLSQLQLEQARLAAIFENAPEGIIVADNQARILMANPAAQDIYRRHVPYEEDMASHTGLNICLPNGESCPVEQMPLTRSALHGEKCENVELSVVWPDGQQRDLLANTAPILAADGQITGAVGVFRDITHIKKSERRTARLVRLLQQSRRRLEERIQRRTGDLQRTVTRLDEELRHRREMEIKLKELNRTLEQRAWQLREMAYALSQAEQRERRNLARLLHDHLQQLLVGAKIHMDMIQRRLTDPRDADALQEVMRLVDESIRASRSLTVELSPPVLYDAGLGRALHWLGDQMKAQHGLTVRVSALDDHEELPEELRVLLFQATRELLFNIVKHAETDQARVRLTQDDGFIEIKVSDGGNGFDAKHAARSPDRDTGFGLYSIRERMELIGGRMQIESRPGEGARITLRAPIKADEDVETIAEAIRDAAADLSEQAESGRPEPIRVILADDHEVLRDGLARLLEEEPDIEVVGQAADGESAIELAWGFRPDVVIMDITMPRLSGTEATRRITRELPGTCVIGLSMHEEADMADAMRRAGAAVYLTKGGDVEMLIAAIRASRERTPDPSSASGES